MSAYSSLGVSLSIENAKLIIKRYDNDRDGFLSYNDVCEIFRPKDEAISKEFGRRTPFDHKQRNLSYETLSSLRTLFHKTL